MLLQCVNKQVRRWLFDSPRLFLLHSSNVCIHHQALIFLWSSQLKPADTVREKLLCYLLQASVESLLVTIRDEFKHLHYITLHYRFFHKPGLLYAMGKLFLNVRSEELLSKLLLSHLKCGYTQLHNVMRALQMSFLKPVLAHRFILNPCYHLFYF